MSDTSDKIALLDPTGDVGQFIDGLAPRVSELDGKAVGFLFNGHYSTPALFDAVKRGLTGRFQFSGVVDKVKPNVGAPSPADTIAELAAGCDLVVLGVGA